MLPGEQWEQAIIAHRSGRIQDAVAGYRRFLEFVPLHAEAHHFLGIGLAQLNAFNEAVDAFRRAIDLQPTDALVRSHLGNALWSIGCTEEALKSYDQAILIDPLLFDAHCNRGKLLNETDSPELALESLNRAIFLAPKQADAHNSKGSALAALGRNSEAIASYNAALQIDPAFAEATWNKSLVLLREGRFQEGWKLHTANPNYQSPNAIRRFPSRAAWDGCGRVNGKTVFLYADQGYGDVIHYCRYAPMLAHLGATVIVQVQEPLRALMGTLNGIHAIIREDEKPPPFDHHCPFSNLPSTFRTDLDSIPSPIPYLVPQRSLVQHWKQRLKEKRSVRVGVVWSGSSAHRQDKHRSIPLSEFFALRDTGVEFVSLQLEVRTADLPNVAELCRWHFGSELQSFADTAALMSQLELVISVDTAAAHLAGAIGIPVWILLPFVPDWRWLLNRLDSPWYPTARLFRQTTRGDWKAPLEAVRRQLIELVGTRR